MSSIRRAAKSLVAAGLVVALTCGVALASIGTGSVTADSLRLRSEATTNSKTLAFAPKGSSVTILEKASEAWYKVSYNNMV